METSYLILIAIVALVAGTLIGMALASRRAKAAAARDRDLVIAREQARLAAEHLATQQRLEAQSADLLSKSRVTLEASLNAEREVLARERRDIAEQDARLDRHEQQTVIRDKTLGEREKTLGERERAFQEREKAVERAVLAAETREAKAKTKEETLEQRIASLANAEQLAAAKLSEIAKLTPEAAREQLLTSLDSELAGEQSQRIARAEKDYLARAKELGIEVVSRAIQRYAAEHTADSTFAKVKLPDEEAKGRIIGKEGRNIKAFELATGVDVIIDETPDAVTISCFDPVRREMARRTLEALLADGRIQPARIEEVLAKVQSEMDRELMKRGEDAAYTCEVSGLHPQLLKLLGKLHFRTSYGQNVLKHTEEVAFLCGAMAADLGLDAKLGRRCGLLHDIGKAIDHEQEGSHPELGYQALKRYNESEVVANAALAHHEGHAVLSAYTTLAAAADAISAARPGARSQNTENYLKRLTQLETIACGHPGVQKAYAIQAGRELRVLVNGHTVPDGEMAKIARDIAKTISDQVAFPGEVRVTLIREMRHIAVAR
jgi:ribonuclease Y